MFGNNYLFLIASSAFDDLVKIVQLIEYFPKCRPNNGDKLIQVWHKQVTQHNGRNSIFRALLFLCLGVSLLITSYFCKNSQKQISTESRME